MSAFIGRATAGPSPRACNSRAVVTIAEAVALVADVRARGKTVVFTNGVFDLLHPGHLRFLQHARAMGDLLIVGVNSDRSVRAIKGPSRPITTQAERAELIAALVKGDDWAEDAIVGRDIVAARGGRIVRVPIESGYATTAIIDRIRRVR